MELARRDGNLQTKNIYRWQVCTERSKIKNRYTSRAWMKSIDLIAISKNLDYSAFVFENEHLSMHMWRRCIYTSILFLEVYSSFPLKSKSQLCKTSTLHLLCFNIVVQLFYHIKCHIEQKKKKRNLDKLSKLRSVQPSQLFRTEHNSLFLLKWIESQCTGQTKLASNQEYKGVWKELWKSRHARVVLEKTIMDGCIILWSDGPKV